MLNDEERNIKQLHPPIINPLDPLTIEILVGVNKLIALDNDGTVEVKISLSLDWTDFHWRWLLDTPYGYGLTYTLFNLS